MSELPEPEPGLPHGVLPADADRLWAMDCPMCRGLGYLVHRNVAGEREDETCPNCKGTGGVELPY